MYFWNIPCIYINLSLVLKKKHLIAVIHQNRKNGPAQCLDSLKIIILIATKLIENKEIWDSVSYINCDVVMMDQYVPLFVYSLLKRTSHHMLYCCQVKYLLLLCIIS